MILSSTISHVKRSIERWLGALVVLTILLSQPVLTFAQTERELLQTAREHMERGQQLYVAGNFQEASDAFMDAFEARPFSAFLYNAAIALDRGDFRDQAITMYERYLQAEPAAPDTAEIQERVAAIRAATQENAAPAAPRQRTETKALVSIESVPEGANVQLMRGDEVAYEGPSPFNEPIDPGEYTLTITHDDCTKSRSLIVGAGRVYVLVFELQQCEFLGYLRAISDPPGANVFIDDREQGAVDQTPTTTPLPIGEHTVWIERPGYEVVERVIHVQAGEELREDFELERVTWGRIRVTGNIPGADVFVDGERVGEVPFEGRVEGGTHEISVSSGGYKSWTSEFTISAGQLTPFRVRLQPTPSRAGAWITSVAALGAIGGATTLLFLGNNLRDELQLDRDAGTLSDGDPRLLRGRIYRWTTTGLYALGGLLGIYSIYLFLRNSGPDSEGTELDARDWALIPSVNPIARSGSLDFRLRF